MEIMLFVQYLKSQLNLSELQYWNVDLQEPYYSYIEAAKKRDGD